MSNEGDKATVLQSTKVRTKLKGDGSWLQRRQEPQAETEKEKPWMAEVRAGRLNGAPIETSPVSSPVKPTPTPENTDTESKTPTPGYLIRGVFTKLDNKPASSPTSNGTSATTKQYAKKASESYKKIAPHTVRSPAPSLEGSLSLEEHEKRTEAASGVLKRSAVRERSYVLSAAKKYEAKEASAETPPVSSSTSFLAKRVQIIDDDDDEGAATQTPASTVLPSPVVPPTSAASAPESKPQVTVDTTIKADAGLAVTKPVAPKVVQVTPEPVKDPIPLSVTKTDPLKDVKPDPNTVNVTKSVQAAPKEPQPKQSGGSEQPVAPKVVQVTPEPVKDPIPLSVTKTDPLKDVKPDPNTVNVTKSVQAAPKEPQPKQSGGSEQPVAPKVVQVTPEPVKDPIPLSVTKTDPLKDVKPDPNTVNVTKTVQAAPKEPQPKQSGGSEQPVAPKVVQVTPEPVKDPIPLSVTKTDPLKDVKPDPNTVNVTKSVQAAPKEPQPKPSGGSEQPVAPKVVQVTPGPVKDPIPLSVTKTDPLKDVKPDPNTVNVTKSVQAAPKEPQPKQSGGSEQPVAPKVVQVTPEPVKDPIPLSVTKTDPLKDVKPDPNTVNVTKSVQAAPKEPQPKQSGGSEQPVAPKVVQVTPEPVKDPIPLSVTKTDPLKDVKPDPNTVNVTKSVQAAPKEPQPKQSGGSEQPVAPKVVQVTPEPVKDPIPLSVTKTDPLKDVKPDPNTVNVTKSVQAAPKEPQPKQSGGSEQPVAPKVVQVTPEPVKDPIPLSVTKTDPLKDVKPDPNTVNVTKSVQAAPKEPQPKQSGGSEQPVAPKVVQVTPGPVKDPIPLSVTKTDPLKDVKPDPNTVNVTKSVQAAPKEPQPKQSGGSEQPVAPKVVQVTPEPVKDPIPLSVTKTDPLKDVKPDPNTVNVTKSVQAAPKEPQPKQSGGSEQPVAPKVVQVTPGPVKDPIPLSVTKTDPLKDVKPDPNTVNVTKSVQAAPKEPQPKQSGGSEQPGTQLVKLVPAIQVPVLPVPKPLSAPTAASPAPVAQLVNKTNVTVKTEPEPKPKTSSTGDTLAALSDTLISFDTNSSSFKDDKTALAKEKGGNSEDSVEREPAPDPMLSNSEPITDDLLGFSDSPEESAEPVPPSPGRWSQDLLSELSSFSVPPEEEEEEEVKQTDETAEETQSNEDSADPRRSRVTTTVTESRINSSIPKSLADNHSPISTDTTSSSSWRSWTRAWEIPQQTTTEESQEDAAEAETQEPAEDQQTLIMFERKSTENDSPWDRWTTPTIYTIGREERGEDEETEEEEEREIQREPEPAMDQYVARTVVEVEQHDKTPEPETKKGFVYVKEYVNATELSLHNARDTIDRQDAFTASSINYSYSSPSSYSRVSQSSTCTYCGEQVGNDAKITIEHLNINCHPTCFKCDMCRKPMGDLLDSMFIHRGKVHCESCYSTT